MYCEKSFIENLLPILKVISDLNFYNESKSLNANDRNLFFSLILIEKLAKSYLLNINIQPMKIDYNILMVQALDNFAIEKNNQEFIKTLTYLNKLFFQSFTLLDENARSDIVKQLKERNLSELKETKLYRIINYLLY